MNPAASNDSWTCPDICAWHQRPIPGSTGQKPGCLPPGLQHVGGVLLPGPQQAETSLQSESWEKLSPHKSHPRGNNPQPAPVVLSVLGKSALLKAGLHQCKPQQAGCRLERAGRPCRDTHAGSRQEGVPVGLLAPGPGHLEEKGAVGLHTKGRSFPGARGLWPRSGESETRARHQFADRRGGFLQPVCSSVGSSESRPLSTRGKALARAAHARLPVRGAYGWAPRGG